MLITKRVKPIGLPAALAASSNKPVNPTPERSAALRETSEAARVTGSVGA